MPYRGKAQKLEIINHTVLAIALLLTIIASVCVGLFSHWGYIIVAIVAFLIVGIIFNKIMKFV